MVTLRSMKHRKKLVEDPPYPVNTYVMEDRKQGTVINVQKGRGSKHLYEVKFHGDDVVYTYGHRELEDLVSAAHVENRKPAKKQKKKERSSSKSQRLQDGKATKDPPTNKENNGTSAGMGSKVIDVTTDKNNALELKLSKLQDRYNALELKLSKLQDRYLNERKHRKRVEKPKATGCGGGIREANGH